MNKIKEPVARDGEYDFVVQQHGNKIKYSFLLESNHYYVEFVHLGPDWKVDYEIYNEQNNQFPMYKFASN
jgi:DNA-dependent RNA polymerase auxiliary subunit epsilon